MIDKSDRRIAAELLRRLASGQVTNDEFADRFPRLSGDDAVRAIRNAAWFLYDDLREYRLTGRYRLPNETRTDIARWVLFLQSDLEYRWPRLNPWYAAPVLVVSVLSAGLAGRLVARQFRSRGEFAVWPFVARTEYEEALKSPHFLHRAV